MNKAERSAIEVVVPYYLSQGYNFSQDKDMNCLVVVPYYLSQGYNYISCGKRLRKVVVPYYLSQGYNLIREYNLE